ncbi:SDR family NAD(P)-dependent oxidoreductase [Stenotrophomonas sp. S48]|uniref:type I polyketide synthase n=1 Tax=unclassified Stenotrophomonas TaxID=196198 RepID=UPI001900DDE9|nr:MULTISPECIES: type I polyketide synthase [unclassified Stenotrophomonas]MBK0025779.1 SDR family NAD(P)-dependent oxidoreductase [Stenotrophomonas sp. S48]MBK0046992.1 SDR family NAD(P)-dependent oxidoreductase [Stenotrophomonas sp. S49]
MNEAFVAPVTAGSTTRIAIIGLACRVRGVDTPEQLWQAIMEGRDTRTRVEEKELRERGVSAAEMADPDYVPFTRSMMDAASFDAGFFEITPRDARYMDPQQRVFMECCHEAMESAGYAPDGAAKNVGVFAGSATSTYMLSNILPSAGATMPLNVLYEHARGNDKDYLTTMVSYKFNLVGPSMSVNVACSTGLASVAQACKSLLDHECDMALAGGVRIELPGGIGYRYQKGNVLSPQGRCAVFDASADGTVWSDGAGVVLLKRLQDAIDDGDFIHATIDGFALNNDGSDKAGYTAPGSLGQQSVIAEALAFAGVSAEQVGYLEAHGTGTVVGDPVEFDALSRTYPPAVDGMPYCGLGSLKANFGHMVNAAGMLGLIKAVLVLRNRTLPPQINFSHVNPDIALAGSAFHIPVSPQPWLSPGRERYAAVSAFGIGGTNAHLILREATSLPAAAPVDGARLLVLSARSAEGLRVQAEKLRTHLVAHPDLSLADVAHTLQRGRIGHAYRASLACRDLAQACTLLAEGLQGHECGPDAPKVVFMLPGQGSQYAAMGRHLHASSPAYREAVDRCLQLLAGTSVAPRVRAALSSDGADAEAALRSTEVTQPAMFVVEYALSQMWMRWGMQPAALIGHSLGEYVAACLAGVMSLEDALAVVVARGRAMEALPAGAMLAVGLSAEAIEPYLGAGCELAASNSPEHVVAAGPAPSIDELAARLQSQGIACKRLDVSHGFHCTLVEDAIPQLRATLSQVRLAAPKIPYVSNVTGTWITDAQATSVDYWIEHLRGTVRFNEGLAEVLQRHPRSVLIEVGPGGALSQLARRQGATGVTVMESMRRSAQDEHAFVLSALGVCWARGLLPDWEALAEGAPPARHVPLPTHAFDRSRHWVDPLPAGVPASDASAQLPLSEWMQMRGWTSLPKRIEPRQSTRCLVFCDAAGEPLVAALRARGQEVVHVYPASAYAVGEGCFAVAVDSGKDHRAVASALREADWKIDHVIHAWGLGADVLAAPEHLSTSLVALMHFAQSFRDDDFSADARMAVVTGRAFDVLGDEIVDPVASGLVAAARTLGDELDCLQTRIIDIDPSEANAWPSLLHELDHKGGPALVALRRGRRWAEQVEPTPLPAADAPTVRAGGAYLLTGGLGGLGRAVATWLARTPGVSLTLLGRSALPPPQAWRGICAAPDTPTRLREQLMALVALQDAGAQVRYVSADLSDPDSVERCIAEAVAAVGVFDGVFHLAGVPSTSVVRAKSDVEIANVLAAKVAGAMNLERALRPYPPRLIVLFSSIAAALGGVGQFEYSAANAYLDGLAQKMNGVGGTRWLSIGWDSWREAGMAVDAVVPANLERYKQQELAQAIGTAEGLQCLQSILAEPSVVHCLLSPRRVALRHKARARQAVQADITLLSPSVDTSEWSETERKVVLSWVNLFGYEQIDRSDNFFDLGGDSLLATKAVAAINEEWSIDIGVRDFLESRNLQDVARLVDALATDAAPSDHVEEQVW